MSSCKEERARARRKACATHPNKSTGRLSPQHPRRAQEPPFTHLGGALSEWPVAFASSRCPPSQVGRRAQGFSQAGLRSCNGGMATPRPSKEPEGYAVSASARAVRTVSRPRSPRTASPSPSPATRSRGRRGCSNPLAVTGKRSSFLVEVVAESSSFPHDSSAPPVPLDADWPAVPGAPFPSTGRFSFETWSSCHVVVGGTGRTGSRGVARRSGEGPPRRTDGFPARSCGVDIRSRTSRMRAGHRSSVVRSLR
jgi:hypothetical protein